MTGLHAWFSAGALTGAIGSAAALAAGVSYRAVYLALAVVMAAGLLTLLLAAIPPLPVPPRPAGTSSGRTERPASPRVWRIPAVLFAIALISVTFFGDGALESFRSTYLQTTLAGGVLVGGFGIGSYHFASLLGRLTATAALRRFGERRVVMAAGLLTAVTAPAAAGAIGGLLLVGFAIAPVVPTTLSLAGRSAPGRSGQAVATTTAAGYGAFIVSPLTIGLLAQARSLRLALAVLVLTSLAIAGLAARWPAVPAIPPQLRCADDGGGQCPSSGRRLTIRTGRSALWCPAPAERFHPACQLSGDVWGWPAP
jgi:hypothetical protein